MRSEVGEHRTRTGEENPPVLALLHTRAEILYNVSLNMCLESAYQTVQFAVQPRVTLSRCDGVYLLYLLISRSAYLVDSSNMYHLLHHAMLVRMLIGWLTPRPRGSRLTDAMGVRSRGSRLADAMGVRSRGSRL